jgi:hypothetical protein
MGGLRKKIGLFALIDFGLASLTAFKQLFTPAIKFSL